MHCLCLRSCPKQLCCLEVSFFICFGCKCLVLAVGLGLPCKSILGAGAAGSRVKALMTGFLAHQESII